MGLKEQVVKDIIRECIEPLLELKKGFEKQENRVDEITEGLPAEKYPSVNAVINFVKNKLTDFSNSISTVYTKVSEFEIYKKDVKTSFENLEKGVADTYATKTVVDDLKTNTEVTRTATGNAITIESSQAPLQNLKLFGKTEQNGTPTPDAPVPLVSVGDSGSFNINIFGDNLYTGGYVNKGCSDYTATTPVFTDRTNRLTFEEFATLEAGTYVISANARCIVMVYDLAENYIPAETSAAWSSVGGTTIDLTESRKIKVTFSYANDTTITIANLGTVTLKQKKQVLEVLHTLPGIPVQSNGNYTDKNNQQWLCDEKDFKTGNRTQNVFKEVFDGSRDWQLLSGSRVSTTLTQPANVDINGLYLPAKAICNIATPVSWASLLSVNAGFSLGNTSNIAFKIPVHTESVEAWKTYLSTNPVTVVYELKTPIETDISETELNDYRHLLTNKGTTNILSEAEAEVEYYVNNANAQAIGSLHEQINKDYLRLQQAIISTGGNV